jgi:hypothetical protein
MEEEEEQLWRMMGLMSELIHKTRDEDITLIIFFTELDHLTRLVKANLLEDFDITEETIKEIEDINDRRAGVE